MQSFDLNTEIDCLDTCKKWLGGVIIEISPTQYKVHYQGFSDQYDEWIEKDSDRILKQFSPGDPFSELLVNNRIDVLDISDKKSKSGKKAVHKWREARVLEVTRDENQMV